MTELHVEGRSETMVPAALRVAAWLLRLAFIPVAAVAGPAVWPTVAIGAAVAMAPIIIERLVTKISPVIHLALAAGALVETTGRAFGLYEGNPLPYDLFAHAIEVAAFACIVLEIARRSLPEAARTPIGLAFTAACLGAAAGVAWELVEAAVDPLLATTLQHGLDDTAQDILAGTIGAALAGAALSRYWAASPDGPR